MALPHLRFSIRILSGFFLFPIRRAVEEPECAGRPPPSLRPFETGVVFISCR